MTIEAASTSVFDPQAIVDALAGWESVQQFLIDHSRHRWHVQPLGVEHEATLLKAMRHPRERFRIMAARLGVECSAVVERAVADRFGRVRAVAASSSLLPATALAELALDPYPGVRLAVATNPNTPGDAAVRLVADQVPEIRRAAAHHDDLPEAVLFELARDRDADVRHAVALNIRSTSGALHRVFTRLRCQDHDTVLVLAQHPNTPLGDLLHLTGSDSHEVRRELAVFRSEPQVLTRLLLDSRSNVHRQVLENPATPTEALEQLPLSLPIDLHELAVQHVNTSEPLYERLAEHYLTMSSEFHRHLGVDLIRRYTSKRPNGMPQPVSPESPRQVLQALFRGGARHVLQACALDRDQPEWLRRHLIRELVFTPDQYRALAADPSEHIRHVVPDLRCPEDVLDLLAQDPADYVRGAVAALRSNRAGSPTPPPAATSHFRRPGAL